MSTGVSTWAVLCWCLIFAVVLMACAIFTPALERGRTWAAREARLNWEITRLAVVLLIGALRRDRAPVARGLTCKAAAKRRHPSARQTIRLTDAEVFARFADIVEADRAATENIPKPRTSNEENQS